MLATVIMIEVWKRLSKPCSTVLSKVFMWSSRERAYPHYTMNNSTYLSPLTIDEQVDTSNTGNKYRPYLTQLSQS